jgi:hypothetical protein
VTLLLIQHRRYPRNVSQRAKRVIEDVGGKLFGVILNNVNIKTDDNYYYYAGYSTQYGYKKRTPRAAARKSPARQAPVQVESDPSVVHVDEIPPIESQDLPKVTFVRPPTGQDRF